MLSREQKKNQMVNSFYLNRWRYLEQFLATSGEHGWFEGPPVTLEELDDELHGQILPDLMSYLESVGDFKLQDEIRAEFNEVERIVSALRPHSPPPDLATAAKLRSEAHKLRNAFIDKAQAYAKIS